MYYLLFTILPLENIAGWYYVYIIHITSYILRAIAEKWLGKGLVFYVFYRGGVYSAFPPSDDILHTCYFLAKINIKSGRCW